MWLTFWWTTAQTRMCVLHETSNGSPSNPAENPNLTSASGHKLKHYGEQAVPMKLRDRRKNLDHVSSVRRQWTHHECGQVLYQGERSMRHVHLK